MWGRVPARQACSSKGIFVQPPGYRSHTVCSRRWEASGPHKRPVYSQATASKLLRCWQQGRAVQGEWRICQGQPGRRMQGLSCVDSCHHTSCMCSRSHPGGHISNWSRSKRCIDSPVALLGCGAQSRISRRAHSRTSFQPSCSSNSSSSSSNTNSSSSSSSSSVGTGDPRPSPQSTDAADAPPANPSSSSGAEGADGPELDAGSSPPTDSSSSGGGPGGGGGSGSSGGGRDPGSGDSPAAKMPKWFQAWVWVTVAVYLVWRWRWRRERAAEREQRWREAAAAEVAEAEWEQFSQRYRTAAEVAAVRPADQHRQDK